VRPDQRVGVLCRILPLKGCGLLEWGLGLKVRWMIFVLTKRVHVAFGVCQDLLRVGLLEGPFLSMLGLSSCLSVCGFYVLCVAWVSLYVLPASFSREIG